ncbi:hypothetical protein [Pontibacter lucknowensis]|uniref:DUF5666 domain-containing protein n=1 Tax=Pontibacter lucknowensis TaxID=1077936 RepID=A0A1N7AU24_9BACT|nr:hypothetical protein [Pontibacter lucknowensis]SIR42619.1 hypothetical protein SAMN05421545_3581 [Pontibacter lucknowensis]
MKNLKSVFAAFALLSLFLYSCQDGGSDTTGSQDNTTMESQHDDSQDMDSHHGESSSVASGTYQGNVKKVEPERTEIYVETDDNKTLELYFRETTRLTRNGETVTFDQLKEGNRVEVQVENEGDRLNPIAVRILD